MEEAVQRERLLKRVFEKNFANELADQWRTGGAKSAARVLAKKVCGETGLKIHVDLFSVLTEPEVIGESMNQAILKLWGEREKHLSHLRRLQEWVELVSRAAQSKAAKKEERDFRMALVNASNALMPRLAILREYFEGQR